MPPYDETDLATDEMQASVHGFAVDTFGDPTRAEAWLNAPNLALGGAKPADLLSTVSEVKDVTRILGTIALGGSA